MNALLITLRLEGPLLVTGLGNGDENSSRSLPYIPGAMLRGLLVARHKKNTSSDLLDDKTAEELFFSGKVRFLNAYLQNTNGIRSLPTPASWRIAKGTDPENMEASDFAIQFDETKETGISKPFWSQTSDHGGNLLDPEEELSIHIGSQNRGIVKRGESTVFQYQALARGQRFVAVIISEDVDLQPIEDLLKNKLLYLGRSRSAKYGRVIVESIKIDTNWHEIEPKNPPVTTITLLSDALLRDQYGQPTHNLDAYLSARLKKNITHEKAFIRSVEVGGFNRKWGLPVTQFPAIGMGSVFVYKSDQFSSDDLTQLVKTGIGERRVDGFGQIAVNWLETPTVQLTKASQASHESKSIQLSESSQKLASLMAERLLEHDLENRLVAITGDLRFPNLDKITNHQLSRLRLVLRSSIDQKVTDFKEVDAFFGNLKKNAEEQWNKTRIISPRQSARLRLWLNERVEKQDGLEELGISSVQQFPKIAGYHAALSNELKVKYTLRLMEAVVNQAMKQNRKDG